MWVDKVCEKCGEEGLYATHSIPMFTEVCKGCFDKWVASNDPLADPKPTRRPRGKHATTSAPHSSMMRAVSEAIRSEDRLNPIGDRKIAEIAEVSKGTVLNVRRELNIPCAFDRGEGFDYSAI